MKFFINSTFLILIFSIPINGNKIYSYVEDLAQIEKMVIAGNRILKPYNDTVVPYKSIYSDRRFSTELYLQLPYHFVHTPDGLYKERSYYKNYINYNVGILLTKYLQKIKLSSGVFFGQMSYYRTFDLSSGVIVDKIRYYGFIPISLSFSAKKINPFFTMLVTRPYYYNNNLNEILVQEIISKTYIGSQGQGHDSPPSTIDDITLKSTTSFLFGLGYKKMINKTVSIYIDLYGALTSDAFLYYGYEPLYRERFIIGTNIRIELFFLTNK